MLLIEENEDIKDITYDKNKSNSNNLNQFRLIINLDFNHIFVSAHNGEMEENMFKYKELVFQTKGKKVQYFNIKKEIIEFVKESNIKNGVLVVQSPHTTCSVIFEEMVHDFDYNGDEFLQVDLNRILEKLIPRQITEGEYYCYPGPKHISLAQKKSDIYKENPSILLNAPAHLKGSLLGASESFIIKDNVVLTGAFGDIYFVDWDYNRSRKRKCHLCILGE